jgi:mannosyltransferase OCH1-like enzyme
MIIHQMWVGQPIPQRYREWGRQLAAMHPDWEYRFWGDDDFGWLANQDLYDDAENLVVDHRVGQLRSDLARYEILERFGGIWLDCDIQPLKPLNAVWGPETFAGWERQGEWVGTSVIGGRAGSAMWKACVQGLRKAKYMTPPGPMHMVTEFAPKYGMHVYPEHTFYPYRTHDIGNVPHDFGESLVAHHWNHLRTVRGKPLPFADEVDE